MNIQYYEITKYREYRNKLKLEKMKQCNQKANKPERPMHVHHLGGKGATCGENNSNLSK
jgi:hypothetical protein